MSILIDKPAGARGMGSWLDAPQQQCWRAALHAGQQHALEIGQSVLVSVTFPVAPRDPLAVCAGWQAEHESFFWEQPARRFALVGAGIAATIQANGDARFAAASAQWRTLLRHAVIVGASDLPASSRHGPILCGGFAFDPHHPRTPLWHGFADCRLSVHRWLYAVAEDQATLTLSHLISLDDDPDALAEAPIPWAAPVDALVDDGPQPLAVQDLRPAEEWMDLVGQTAQMIRAGAFQKVVLARAVAAHAARPFAPPVLLARLRNAYPTASVFAVRRGALTFIGATPEQLARIENGRVQTMALAGSAPRGATPAEDDRIGAELLVSLKNRGEHAIVAETIAAALALHSREVQIADQPHLLKLPNVQHLETLISGDLLPNRSILDVIGELHPTPAVGGAPREAALAVIRAGEEMDRGWYAAPLGWLDAAGYGEFAVALRSALVAGDHATLFAGCGIVADSIPASEYAESRLKLNVMLRALSGAD
jgi:isochorismate synthase